MLQDLDTEARLGSEKSPRLVTVYGELLNEHLNANRLSNLYVLVKTVAFKGLICAWFNLANSNFLQAWGKSRSPLNETIARESPMD